MSAPTDRYQQADLRALLRSDRAIERLIRDSRPEWVRRAQEARLPVKVYRP
jgi:hypothetical protein